MKTIFKTLFFMMFRTLAFSQYSEGFETFELITQVNEVVTINIAELEFKSAPKMVTLVDGERFLVAELAGNEKKIEDMNCGPSEWDIHTGVKNPKDEIVWHNELNYKIKNFDKKNPSLFKSVSDVVVFKGEHDIKNIKKFNFTKLKEPKSDEYFKKLGVNESKGLYWKENPKLSNLVSLFSRTGTIGSGGGGTSDKPLKDFFQHADGDFFFLIEDLTKNIDLKYGVLYYKEKNPRLWLEPKPLFYFEKNSELHIVVNAKISDRTDNRENKVYRLTAKGWEEIYSYVVKSAPC